MTTRLQFLFYRQLKSKLLEHFMGISPFTKLKTVDDRTFSPKTCGIPQLDGEGGRGTLSSVPTTNVQVVHILFLKLDQE